MEGSMRVFGLLFCFLSLPLLAANEITTQIHDIDYGKRPNDEVLVFLTSGHVAKLRQTKSLYGVDIHKSKGKWVRVLMDSDQVITDVSEADAPIAKAGAFSTNSEAEMSYVPTTVESIAVAKKYFSEARYNPKDSQCFNRAMVWTYEWWRKHSLKSNKILIFFTRNYIRRYNFEWWFHIAPYIHVMENGKVVERVMDRKYGRGPMEFVKWTNLFMKNDAPCPVIKKFSEYADSPYSGECFITRTHMYTYQPADLQMYEAWGYAKNNFNMDEVRGAYLEAFDENL
jgi:hypothetical protein